MDQLKDFLKQCVKYRFWIAAGLSALLPMIGYLVGAGPINAKADAATKDVENAKKGVEAYQSPGLPNDQWKPLVDTKKQTLTTDVDKAWTKLYARQAPLLTWPKEVEERFKAWGRKWPEDVDKGVVQKTIVDYIIAYDREVEGTYKKINPWNYVDGTGIVVVPDMASFLRPSTFDVGTPPTLTQVWSAQERLWVQGTLLDAIAKINAGAKDWDGAVVKQVNVMEVGSPLAQDQKSAAKGEAIEAAKSIDPEGAAPAEAAPADGGMPGPGKMMGSGGAAGATEDVYYITSPSAAYKILPVQLTVLVDQNRLQEFFIGLENSPMTIQVQEFEMYKPLISVAKPVKGDTSSNGMMSGIMGSGSGGMMPGGRGGRGMIPGGKGGEGGLAGPGGFAGAGGEPGPMGGRGRMMPGMGAGGVGGGGAQGGVNKRGDDREKKREEIEKKRKAMTRSIDQYYDIVEVTVYGQARFYEPPPPPPAIESESNVPAAPVTPEPAKTEETPTSPLTPTSPEPAKAEEKKADEPATKPEGEPKKTDEPSKTDPAPPAEASKAEAPKTETPKPADAPKR